VGDAVRVAVGVEVMVRVAVTVTVSVAVAVGGSRVAVDVGDAAVVGSEGTVGVFVQSSRGMKVNARRRTSPINPGIPNLMRAGGSVFLYGATVGAVPVNPSGGRSFLKFSGYSPTAKLTKLIVFNANGISHGASRIGMIFLRSDSAWVYSLRTHSDSTELGVRTTLKY